jgi:agmatinase
MTTSSNTAASKLETALQRTLTNHRHRHIGDFFKRLQEEGAPVFAASTSQDLCFYSAPKRRDLTGVDIACMGVPMDTSAPLRAGAKHGPNALREWSKLRGPIHESWTIIPFEMCSIIDYGDVEFTRPHDTAQSVDDIYQTYSQLNEAGVVPFSVGGVHTLTHPILKALGHDEPLGLVHIDAHADTFNGDYQGESLSDASVFRNAVLDSAIDPERTVQIGIRGRATHFWDFSYDMGMRVITMDDFDEMGIDAVIAEARNVVGNGPCYLTLDCDGIDATYLPGTQMPEPFGLTSREVLKLIRGLRGLDLVGADIVELCPPYDPHGISANLAAALGFEMLCLLAEARVARAGKTRKTHWS